MFGLNLDNSGLFILAGFVLVICSAIMFYCFKKFSMLESVLSEQGKIVQTILMRSSNVNSENNPYLTSESVLNSAINEAVQMNNKIEVSDNEDDDSSSEYDSYSESSVEEERITMHNENSNNINMDIMSQFEDVKVIEMENVDSQLINTLDVNEISHNNLSNLMNIKNITRLSDTDSQTSHTSASSSIIGTKDYAKLKVHELRSLIIDKGLSQNKANLKKMKRDDLLQVLELGKI